jgi:hypothetical protein
VIQRFPRSNEALQARQQLKKAGVPTASATPRRAEQ